MYLDGDATQFNFDLFTRGDDGDQLNKIEQVSLRGPGSMISGISGFSMSLEILPNLRDLSI